MPTIEPGDREEMLLQGILNGDTTTNIEPGSRKEMLLKAILENGNGLPDVTQEDDGKVAAVVNGAWDAANIPEGNLPPVTVADNKKVLRVGDDGNYGASSLSDITGDWAVVNGMPLRSGWLTAKTGWNYCTNSAYRHLIIPVASGDSVKLIGNAERPGYYAIFQSYETPSDGETPSYADDTSRVSLIAGRTEEFTIPSDGKFIYLAKYNNGNDCGPATIIINGYEYTQASYADAIKTYIDAADTAGKAYTDTMDGLRKTYVDTQDEAYKASAIEREIALFGVDGFLSPVTWELGSLSGNSGAGYPVTDVDTNTRWRTADPYKSSTRFTVVCDPEYYFQVFLLDNSLNLTSTAFTAFRNERYTIPANTYFRVVVGKKPPSGGSAPDISDVDITTKIAVKFDRISNLIYSLPVRWCALGDSITSGYYSWGTGVSDKKEDKSVTWASKVALKNGWELTNLAVGGTGFLDPDNDGVGYEIARDTDFSGYNLVTIAYGINDWKGDQPFGDVDQDIAQDVSEIETPTTVLQAMKIVIESIFESNPNCKVIGILPLNCCRYGNKAGNYGLGYSFTNSGTLEEFTANLKKVYEWYGIQYIDMTHSSCVNRWNIVDALPDEVHPSLACHDLIAHELSRKITF